jgi:hypothetical protein
MVTGCTAGRALSILANLSLNDGLLASPKAAQSSIFSAYSSTFSPAFALVSRVKYSLNARDGAPNLLSSAITYRPFNSFSSLIFCKDALLLSYGFPVGLGIGKIGFLPIIGNPSYF